MKKPYIYACLTVFIWSTMAAGAKLLLTDIPNLETLAVSGLFAFLSLLLINIKTGTIQTLGRYSGKDYAIMAGLGFLGLFLYSALYYYGLTQLTSQEACILNYLWPIMLVLFSAIILKERITAGTWVAMLFSFLGVVILSAGGGSSAGGMAPLGVAACVLAAACYGLFSVLNKKADYDQNIAMMVIWLVVAVCSAALGLATEAWVPLTGAHWLGMLWLGVVVDAVAYLLWALALNGATHTGSIANLAYLTPFLSLIVSAVLLQERIRLRALIALVFIIGGILLQNFAGYLRGRRTTRSH